MARFRINSLNYMTSGKYETFVNVDMREHEPVSAVSLLRTERDEKLVDTEDGLSCIDVSYYSQRPDVIAEIAKRTANLDKRNKTFLLERLQPDALAKNYGNFRASGRTVYPAFDILDVSVKSRRADGLGVYGFTDDYANIYAPDISSDPIGFCRYLDECCVLTQYSDQRAKTLRIDMEARDGAFYEYRARKFDDGQFLYGNPSSISAAALSSGTAAAAYAAFSPKREIQQISGNYAFVMNQSGGDNNYSAGDVYGDVYETKKTLDSSYSMNMTDAVGMNGCREYVGVLQCGGKTFLKFDDGIRYEFRSGTQVKERKFGYQKIEEFSVRNVAVPAKHKSNVYSVVLNNTCLNVDSDDTPETQRMKANLRLDIANAIREMAESVCPANTQLLDVVYES